LNESNSERVKTNSRALNFLLSTTGHQSDVAEMAFTVEDI